MELKNFFAQDLMGNVIPNPTITVYQPGTTTLATGLQNAAGAALANPFNGSGNGQVTLAAPDGDYDLKIAGAGRTTTMRVRFIDANGFIQAGTGAVPRTMLDKGRESVSVKDFGAVGDGVTDDTAAFQKALTKITDAGGGDLYLPPGTYNLSSLNVGIVPPSNCNIFGAGQGITTILWPGTANLFYNADTATRQNVSLSAFTIKGQFETTPSDGGRYPILLRRYNNLRIENVEVAYSRTMSIALRYCTGVHVVGNYVHHGARDGISVGTCDRVTVSNNRIEFIDDDAIAKHTATDDGEPPSESFVCEGNQIRNTGGGIHCLGARHTSITGNTIRLATLHGIRVHMESTTIEGRNTAHSVSITGNTITDVLDRATIDGLNSGADYIVVIGNGQAGSLAAIPGEVNTSTASIVPLYPSINNNLTSASDTAKPIAKPRWLTITGNTLSRTLYPTAAFSDYGYGLFWTRSGFINPAITAATLGSGGNGIRFIRSAKYVAVTGNVINGIGAAIAFAGGSTGAAALAFQGVVISGNSLADFVRGVSFDSNVTDGQDVLIDGNMFDGDPYLTSSNRGANGTWLADGTPTGVDIQSTRGIKVQNNVFKNVCRTVDQFTSSGSDRVSMFNNYAHCDPAALAFSTLNKGIGNVARSGDRMRYIITDSDPASANYGKILNNCHIESNAVPTSGKYVAGHVVKNNSLSISAGKVLFGWARLTTGNGHVLNTDWSALYATNE